MGCRQANTAISAVPETMQQHVIDPEICTACMSCMAVCPSLAIAESDRHMAIDFDKCNGCDDCLAECATGAIDAWLIVMVGEEFSLEEQFAWERLPAANLV